jgi:hypothetical protein
MQSSYQWRERASLADLDVNSNNRQTFAAPAMCGFAHPVTQANDADSRRRAMKHHRRCTCQFRIELQQSSVDGLPLRRAEAESIGGRLKEFRHEID